MHQVLWFFPMVLIQKREMPVNQEMETLPQEFMEVAKKLWNVLRLKDVAWTSGGPVSLLTWDIKDFFETLNVDLAYKES